MKQAFVNSKESICQFYYISGARWALKAQLIPLPSQARSLSLSALSSLSVTVLPLFFPSFCCYSSSSICKYGAKVYCPFTLPPCFIVSLVDERHKQVLSGSHRTSSCLYLQYCAAKIFSTGLHIEYFDLTRSARSLVHLNYI